MTKDKQKRTVEQDLSTPRVNAGAEARAVQLRSEIQIWPTERFVEYARNPRKNDGAVDRMCSSVREFGFKIPILARSDGEVVDGARHAIVVLPEKSIPSNCIVRPVTDYELDVDSKSIPDGTTIRNKRRHI